jgi:hypothetical protein
MTNLSGLGGGVEEGRELSSLALPHDHQVFVREGPGPLLDK